MISRMIPVAVATVVVLAAGPALARATPTA
jgi:hypothetical protein